MGALANIGSTITLATAVAPAGTVVVSYPTGMTQALLQGTTLGGVDIDSDSFPQGTGNNTCSFSFGASTITITNNCTTYTWPAGAKLFASFGRSDVSGRYGDGVRVMPAIAALTAGPGTVGTSIADVGAAYTQATLNNNFATLTAELNAVVAALNAAGLLAQ